MKRFFPLILGFSVILFSFTIVKSPYSNMSNSPLVTTLLDICEFKYVVGNGSNQCPGMPAEMTISTNCEGSVIANLLVANLDDTPMSGQQYSLPSGVPALYIETEVNGVINVVGPIQDFMYNGRIQKVGFDIYPIFEHECILTFDMFEECSNGSTSIIFDAKITDDNGNIYPVVTYSDFGEIFQYDIFTTTTPDYVMEGCAEHCNGCGTRRVAKEKITQFSSETFTNEDEFDMIEINDETDEEASNISFEVSPNPFIDDITLLFNRSFKSAVNVEVINTNGKVALSQSHRYTNSNLLKIDGSGLNSGVYYVRVIANGQAQTKKIVKY